MPLRSPQEETLLVPTARSSPAPKSWASSLLIEDESSLVPEVLEFEFDESWKKLNCASKKWDPVQSHKVTSLLWAVDMARNVIFKELWQFETSNAIFAITFNWSHQNNLRGCNHSDVCYRMIKELIQMVEYRRSLQILHATWWTWNLKNLKLSELTRPIVIKTGASGSPNRIGSNDCDTGLRNEIWKFGCFW